MAVGDGGTIIMDDDDEDRLIPERSGTPVEAAEPVLVEVSVEYLMLVYSRVEFFSACSRWCTVSMWCCTAMYTNLYWASVWTMPLRWLRT